MTSSSEALKEVLQALRSNPSVRVVVVEGSESFDTAAFETVLERNDHDHREPTVSDLHAYVDSVGRLVRESAPLHSLTALFDATAVTSSDAHLHPLLFVADQNNPMCLLWVSRTSRTVPVMDPLFEVSPLHAPFPNDWTVRRGASTVTGSSPAPGGVHVEPGIIKVLFNRSGGVNLMPWPQVYERDSRIEFSTPKALGGAVPRLTLEDSRFTAWRRLFDSVGAPADERRPFSSPEPPRAVRPLDPLVEELSPDFDIPTPIEVLQARRNAEARAKLLSEFGGATSTEIAEMFGSTAVNKAQLASRLRAAGRLLGVSYRGITRFPGFQFHDGELIREMQPIISTLRDAKLSDWQIAIWFTTPTGWLSDQRPVDLLLEAPGAVVEAASLEVADFGG